MRPTRRFLAAFAAAAACLVLSAASAAPPRGGEAPAGRERPSRDASSPTEPAREAGRPGAPRPNAPAGGRELAELLEAVRRSDPTPEQQRSIRELLAGMQARGRGLAKEHAEEMRRLLEIRRELLAEEADPELVAAVDRRLGEVRAAIADPAETRRKVLELLDPERRASVEAALAAAERRAPRGVAGTRGDGERRREPQEQRGDGTARDRLRQRAGDRTRERPEFEPSPQQ